MQIIKRLLSWQALAFAISLSELPVITDLERVDGRWLIYAISVGL